MIIEIMNGIIHNLTEYIIDENVHIISNWKDYNYHERR